MSGPSLVERLAPLFRGDKRFELASIGTARVIGGTFLARAGLELPCELYLWPSPRSYTGQPMAEIHTIGSRPLLDAALATLCSSGFRLAERGEFTLRAFLAGRLDLTQAEAVLGAIDAADAREFDVALAQLAGGLAGPLHRLRDRLLDLLAHLEAGFDFADEDLPFLDPDQLRQQLSDSAETVTRLARQMTSRTETSDAIRVALVGRPNTGKSSLFNALVGRPGALVSEEPGTTRDYLTAELDLEGVRCRLIDTAGMETAPHPQPPELWAAGQEATREQAELARVRLLCVDSTRWLVPAERSLLDDGRIRTLVLLTKCDLPSGTDYTGPAVRTSSRTGEGLDSLRDSLRNAILAATASDGDVVAGTAIRCQESLRAAAECLGRALEIVETGCAEELIAAEIRIALEELGKVVGTVYTEDVLDRIFSRFCIGK